MVGLLALAHIRACEAEVAAVNAELNPDRLPVPTRSAAASHPILPIFPTLLSMWRPCSCGAHLSCAARPLFFRGESWCKGLFSGS
jgi:hypothetical protein